jgi:hypothetical protein
MVKPSLLDLRPCQFVLGMKEVEGRIEKMRQLSKSKLQQYLDDRVIPTVRGPKRELYVIDLHHLARACWELDIKDYSVRIMEDLSQLSEFEFWSRMIKRDWTYLHDQFGLGPHNPSALPADIRCLADDPYRSLVWAVIKRGGIEKERIPFFEFKWAAFFRLNVPGRLTSKSDFSTAIQAALTLAKTRHADHLPGFVGKPAKVSKKKKT